MLMGSGAWRGARCRWRRVLAGRACVTAGVVLLVVSCSSDDDAGNAGIFAGRSTATQDTASPVTDGADIAGAGSAASVPATRRTSTTTAPPPTSSEGPTVVTQTTVPSLEVLYDNVESGVFQVFATTCGGSGIGTGFLVAPDKMVTAAHVVAGAVGVAVDGGDEAIPGVVLAVDPELDVALIDLERPVEGHVFELAAEMPSPGREVAAIGFPLDQRKTLTSGTISGVEREMQSEAGHRVLHLLQTDVALNPGNSGGPLIDDHGEVIGIVSSKMRDAEGVNFAASAAIARPVIEAWQSSGEPVAPPNCVVPTGPEYEPPIAAPPEVDDIDTLVIRTFEVYFTGINIGNYEQARVRVAPEERLEAAEWEDGISSTYDFDIVLHDIRSDGSTLTAWVTFTSLQVPDKGPRPGEACTLWSIDYTLIPADDGLLWIEHSTGHAGGPISAPCD